MTGKQDQLNQRLGEAEPKMVTVEVGDELIQYAEEDVEDYIITSTGGAFIVQDGDIYRYSADQVQEIVYPDQGLDQEDEEGEDSGE